MDANTLIEENMGRLTLAARKLSRNFGVPDMLEDFIQEGSIAQWRQRRRLEICNGLKVSPAVARKLILEYRETFNTVPLDDAETFSDNYGDPEQVNTEKIQRTATIEALSSLSSFPDDHQVPPRPGPAG